MRRQMILGWLWVAVLFTGPAYGAPQGQLLQDKDVQKIMGQLLQYHVEDHEMTTELVGRSFRLYIEGFDPDRVYVLDSEFKALSQPAPKELKQDLGEYYQDDLTPYKDLDAVLAKAIVRARKSREELYAHRDDLFVAASSGNLPTVAEDRPFAASETELKQRTQDYLILFINEQKKLLPDPLTDIQKKKILALYEREMRHREYAYLGQDEAGQPLSAPLAQHQLAVRILKADAKSLDPHSAYYSPEEAAAMKGQLEQGLSGIGVMVQEGIEGVVIAKVIEGSPAAKSGQIFAQDRIVEINGKSIIDTPFEQVVEEMHGQAGSAITLGIIHQGDKESNIQKVALERGKVTFNEQRIETSFVPVTGGIIGEIKLHLFYEGDTGISADHDVKAALAHLREQGELKGLVLDLRDNPGGFLTQAVKVAGLFISNGIIVVAEYANGQIHCLRDIDGRTYFDGPMVILTSKMSASAAEIVAQALQDYGAALVVGDEHTFGKGSIQYQTITEDHADNYYKVTVGRYYTPSGRSTQFRGVVADIVVPTAEADEKVEEKNLEFPLASHDIHPFYQDDLSDVSAADKRWFTKYYLPSLQAKRTQWSDMLPTLRQRSAARLSKDADYQKFLATLAEGKTPSEPMDAKGQLEDLQMNEAVNIVKDMIALERQPVPAAAPAAATAAPQEAAPAK